MAFLAAIKGLRDKDKAKEKAWDLADSAEFQMPPWRNFTESSA